MMDESLLPCNIDAEQAVLGSLLLSPVAIDRAQEILTPAAFYRDVHRALYEASIALHARGEPVDLVTLPAQVADGGMLDTVGGYAYLCTLMEAPSTHENVAYYAQLVYDKYLLRRLMDTGQTIHAMAARTDAESGQDILATAERLVSEIATQRATTSLIPLKPLVAERLAEFKRRIECKGVTGAQTPFDDYNYMTAGLHPEELTIIAGRPSMGKTAAMVQIGLHFARTHGPVALFSIEMSRAQITDRMLFSEARVDSNQARTGCVTPADLERTVARAQELSELPLYVDDDPITTILEIRAKARRLHAEGPLSLILVDYLQLVGGSRRGVNRNEEMGEVARGLKAISRELHIPVVALAQLSRAVENRPDKRPILSDLRESGSIEAEADVVTFLYRDAYYTRAEAPGGGMEVAEWIIAKQRNGPTGKVEMGWIGEFTRFENLEDRRGAQMEPAEPQDTRDPYASDDPFDDADNPYGTQWRGG